jgi:hypothetical protein
MLIMDTFAALGIETDSVEAAAGAGNPPESRGSAEALDIEPTELLGE